MTAQRKIRLSRFLSVIHSLKEKSESYPRDFLSSHVWENMTLRCERSDMSEKASVSGEIYGINKCHAAPQVTKYCHPHLIRAKSDTDLSLLAISFLPKSNFCQKLLPKLERKWNKTSINQDIIEILKCLRFKDKKRQEFIWKFALGHLATVCLASPFASCHINSWRNVSNYLENCFGKLFIFSDYFR